MASGRNLLKPANGDLVADPKNDMVLGVYYLTRKVAAEGPLKHFNSLDEAQLAMHFGVIDLHTPIVWNRLETTIGRMIFNREIEEKVDYVNDTITKKKLTKILSTITDRHGVDVAREVIDRVKMLGFQMATNSGITWAMADLVIPKEKKEIMGKAE